MILFPDVSSYVKGERDAIHDNWEDLFNYNKTQKELMDNLFSAVTMPDKIDMTRSTADMSKLKRNFGMATYDPRLALALQMYKLQQQYAPELLALKLAGMKTQQDIWKSRLGGTPNAGAAAPSIGQGEFRGPPKPPADSAATKNDLFVGPPKPTLRNLPERLFGGELPENTPQFGDGFTTKEPSTDNSLNLWRNFLDSLHSWDVDDLLQ